MFVNLVFTFVSRVILRKKFGGLIMSNALITGLLIALIVFNALTSLITFFKGRAGASIATLMLAGLWGFVLFNHLA